ncbi:unnamed protein product [Allacma fusca]|uniref:Uncharacterized protein n=1 Tax=Allacma fusca TaxID=39272 RepID=A0A8J2JKB1_9HEXA|nr:unnamed protein product [Allacma fusca]
MHAFAYREKEGGSKSKDTINSAVVPFVPQALLWTVMCFFRVQFLKVEDYFLTNIHVICISCLKTIRGTESFKNFFLVSHLLVQYY